MSEVVVAEQNGVDVSSEESPVSGFGRNRNRVGFAIAAVWIVVQAAIQVAFSDDATQRIVFTYYVSPCGAFLLLMWWMFFPGPSRPTRHKRRNAAGLCAAAVAAFFVVFRHDGFSGDFVPQFSLRSRPTPQDTARKYWANWDATARRDGTETPINVESTELEIAEADWPQFRGPGRDGIAHGEQIRGDWTDNPPRVLWRHPVGAGWSSFAVIADRVWTQELRDRDECVVCYEANTGDEIWIHSDDAPFSTVLGGDGPRATPTIHDSRLYSLGATGILNCLDPITGAVYWSTNILDDAGIKNRKWGMAGSPLVYEDKVIVNPGGKLQRGVIAYDRLTGKVIWTGGDFRASYAAPRVESINGRPVVLIFDANGAAGHDPKDGSQLWRYPFTNQPRINAAQMIVHRNYVLISSGYGTGCALLDTSHPADDGRPRDVWPPNRKLKMKFNGGVYRDGIVFGLDEGIIVCFDVQSGTRRWKKGRFGYGQMLLAGEHLLVQAESGEVVLLEANVDRYVELGRFQAIEGKTWNHPVLHRGRLFVRNAGEAACYDIR